HSLITRIDFNLFCRFDELSIPDYSHQPYPGLPEKDAYAVIIGYRSFKRSGPMPSEDSKRFRRHIEDISDISVDISLTCRI
ncbi:TPA: hypothetical protein ACJKFA_000463, partial [Neisseria meningitidis]